LTKVTLESCETFFVLIHEASPVDGDFAKMNDLADFIAASFNVRTIMVKLPGGQLKVFDLLESLAFKLSNDNFFPN